MLVIDDISYVRRSELETSVLFDLICHRYERRSLLVTPFHAPPSVPLQPAHHSRRVVATVSQKPGSYQRWPWIREARLHKVAQRRKT
jgi:hypothetical protein